MNTNIELWVFTHNKKLKNNGIVKFPLNQKDKAYKLFEKYKEITGKYGQPFIVLKGRTDEYEPDFDANPTKHEIRTGYAGKFSWKRMFDEWLEENISHDVPKFMKI